MSHIPGHPSASILPEGNIQTPLSSVYEENRPTTPFVKRIASLRLPNDQSRKEVSDLAPLLFLDLKGQIIDAVPDLIETIFPDNILPFLVDEALLNSLLSVYDPHTYKWKLAEAKTETVSTSFITEHCGTHKTYRHSVLS